MWSSVARLLAWPLAWPVEAYIRIHRERLLAGSVPIGGDDTVWLYGYFSEALLRTVRVVERNPLPIAGPPLAATMRRIGFQIPEVAEIAAITFDFLIATREPMDRATLFHELVHVAQYRAMGVRGFTREYVRGLLQSGAYEGIPLEVAAYELERRFLAGQKFQVEEEIAKPLGL